MHRPNRLTPAFCCFLKLSLQNGSCDKDIAAVLSCHPILSPHLIVPCSRRNFVCMKTVLVTTRTAEIHRITDLGASLGRRNFQSNKKSRLESNSRSFALRCGPGSFFTFQSLLDRVRHLEIFTKAKYSACFKPFFNRIRRYAMTCGVPVTVKWPV